MFDTEIKIHSEIETVHLSFKGNISMHFTEIFETKLEDALAGGHKKILLDFQEVEIIASNGLRVLLVFAKKAKKGNIRFAVCSLNDRNRQIFDLAGFTEIFEIHPSHETAILAFGK